MDKYPDRLWKVGTGARGVIAREFAAKETKTMFKVTSDGFPPEQHIKKPELGRLQKERGGDLHLWCLPDEVHDAIEFLTIKARQDLTERIEKLRRQKEAMDEKPGFIKFEHAADPGPVTDDMF